MPEEYFKDTRLYLTGFGEVMVRLVTYSSYIFLTIVTAILLLSDIPALYWFASFLLLFLIDRILDFRKGERSIKELERKNKRNVAESLTPSAYRLLSHSFRKSLVTKEKFILILLDELSTRRDVRDMLRRLDISPKELRAKIEEYLGTEKEEQSRKELLAELETLSIGAYKNARVTDERFVEPRNLFSAVAESKDASVQKLLTLFNIVPKDVAEAVVFSRYVRIFSKVRILPSSLGGFVRSKHSLRERAMNRAWTARPTPALDALSVDLTALAKQSRIGFMVGHEKELETLIETVTRPGKPNALLVGQPGAGKSTIIDHLAYKMTKDDVPRALFDKRLVALDIGKILANAKQEDLAGRLQLVVEEILIAGNIVLVIPSIHDLFKTGGDGRVNFIDLLLPIVKSESIPMIGETFPREFKEFIEPRTDFLDQFDVVEVNEVSEAEATRFLIYQSLLLERQFKIFITFNSIRKSVMLAHRYFRSKLLPGSAVSLLKQALAVAHERGLKTLTEEPIMEVAETKSKIPIQRAGKEEAEKLLNLEGLIHERLINQEEAVRAVSGALREYRSGLARQGGPIATFLFVGPTGVGKTELSKILTTIQFGSKDLMLRFDMSEYQDKQSIFRFIGTPDGKKTGELTDAVLKNPYSLVLLDEFEKAHPDILNLFLQVFDDGRLTDSLGRVADFQNTIIIATSNAHSDFIKTEIEKERPIAEIGEDLKKKLTDYFRPELINRFSSIIAFRNLNREEIARVAQILLKEVSDLLMDTNGIELKVEKSALLKVAELGYSPVFGARPLRQVISQKIRGALAEKILKKEIARGNILSVGFEEGDFNFKVVE